MSFKVWNDSNVGFKTKIEVNGERVDHNIREVCIHAAARGPVTITLDPAVDERVDRDEPARLIFCTEGTRELLVKHGWTPPAEA